MNPQQLSDFLKQHFQGCEPKLEQAAPADKVGGYLIWDGFDGMDQIDRQAKLREVVRMLPVNQRQQVTAILTYTPTEWTVMSEG